MKKFLFGLIFLSFIAAPLLVFSQDSVVQETSTAPEGFYAGISTGRFYFLDSTDKSDYRDAWMIGVRAGYDIIRYAAVEVHWKFSAHDTAFVGRQSIPDSFIAHQLTTHMRANYPLTRRFALTGEIGGGLWYSDPNIDPNVGAAARWILTSGLGIQYFLKMKGMVMGMDPTLGLIRDLNGPILQLTGYLRYTF